MLQCSLGSAAQQEHSVLVVHAAWQECANSNKARAHTVGPCMLQSRRTVLTAPTDPGGACVCVRICWFDMHISSCSLQTHPLGQSKQQLILLQCVAAASCLALDMARSRPLSVGVGVWRDALHRQSFSASLPQLVATKPH